MPTKLFTDKALRSLKTTRPQEDYVDSSFRSRTGSFGLRVFSSGKKVFFFLYRNTRNERRRYTIGEFPAFKLSEARERALEIAASVSHGEDPAQEKTTYKRSETVADLCHDFLELHSKPNNRPATYYEYKRMIELDILPQWQHLKACDITRRDVIELIDNIRIKRNVISQANRTRSLIHTLFNFALQREMVAINPCIGLPRKTPEASRSRFLSEDEIKTLYETIEKDDDLTTRNLLKILLLTAQRLREVSKMRWSEIDTTTWTIPADRTKNRRAHRVHLSRPVMALLEELKSYNLKLKDNSRKTEAEKAFYNDLVFPSRYGSAINWINHKARRIVETMKIPRWTPHDLRRTAASHMADMGIASDTIEAILNHRPRGVAGIYQRGTRFQDCAVALDRWANQVHRIVHDKCQKKDCQFEVTVMKTQLDLPLAGQAPLETPTSKPKSQRTPIRKSRFANRKKKFTALKPQDVFLSLKLLLVQNEAWRLIDLSQSLGLSQSEICQGLQRLSASKLADSTGRGLYKSNLYEFLIHGVKYIFPPVLGSRLRGVPVEYSTSPVSFAVRSKYAPTLVWPWRIGSVRGESLIPLYPTVPGAALADQSLHNLLALLEAIRIGRASEHEIASIELKKLLLNEPEDG